MVHRTAVLMVKKMSRRARRRLFEESKWQHPLYGADKTPPEGRMKGLMKGLYPVTRTRDYLKQGIVFRDCVEVMTINASNYKDKEDANNGIRSVINMNLQQMRYKNPDVQIEVLENLTPTPFITCYLDSGEKFYMDVEGKQHFEILSIIQKTIGKPKGLLDIESAEVKKNPANFGEGYLRKCICMVQGQVPCSSMPIHTPGYALALHGKCINLNPKKYPFGVEE